MMLAEDKYLEYSDSAHAYYVDGKEYISVTRILDLAGFVNNFCRDEEASKRGSDVHMLCALDDESTLDMRRVPAAYRGYVKAWRRYRKDSMFSPELIEQRVDDHSLCYSGRLDRMGRRPGQAVNTIVDIKTNKSGTVAEYVRLQLVAYAHALKPNHIFERIAVALRPDGKYNCRIFPLHDFQRDLAEFYQILKRVKEQS